MSHQKKAAKQLRKKLKKYGMAILSGEPRSGKTLSFLSASVGAGRVLVISQKSALKDIRTQATAIGADVEVVNFHQVKKLSESYDLIIVDESHRWITGYPKRSTIWKDIRRLSQGVPMIFSSGTLTPEGYSGLFNMLALSDFSPWRSYDRFTQWHAVYGRPYSMMINGININKYDRTQEEKVKKRVKKYTVTITRKEAGHVHEAVDHSVKIEQSQEQRDFYHQLQQDLIIETEEGVILADTPAKLLTKLHQTSGGFCRGEEDYVLELQEKPKLEWIHENIDPETTIILAHYQHEQKILEETFPHTGSITKNAEGIDFSHFKTMVIYSMAFSAATYEQVRARQMNFSRDSPIEIIYLLSGIDEYVYKAVKKKKNFTASWYRRQK